MSSLSKLEAVFKLLNHKINELKEFQKNLPKSDAPPPPYTPSPTAQPDVAPPRYTPSPIAQPDAKYPQVPPPPYSPSPDAQPAVQLQENKESTHPHSYPTSEMGHVDDKLKKKLEKLSRKFNLPLFSSTKREKLGNKSI